MLKNRLHFPFVALIVCLCALPAAPQSAPTTPVPAASSFSGTLRGTVKSGSTPLPGVTITAANTLTGKKVITSTDLDGNYSLSLTSKGRYVVRAEIAAFAIVTKEVLINAGNENAQVDIDMVLLSRVPKPAPEDQERLAQLVPGANGADRGSTNGARRLNVDESLSANENGNSASETPLQGMPAMASAQEATNESVAVSGNLGQTQNMGQNIDDIRDRIEEMRARGELPGGDFGPGGPGGGGPGGAFGGGPGVFIMRGGQGGRGGRGGFNVNTIHGSVFYNLGNSALDASPYSLSGPADKPEYSSNRFGATIGGPLKIPKLFDLGKNTFFFFNMFGTRATNPYTVFSQVPTLAERGCPTGAIDASQCTGPYQFSRTIIDPTLGTPFANNQIPSNRLDSVAAALLKYIPLPNTTGAKNFAYSASGLSDSTNVAFRIMHTFGSPKQKSNNPLRRTGRNSINFGFNYTNGSSDLLRPFPSVAGTTTSHGLNGNLGLTTSHNKWTNQFRANFNQSRSTTTNLYAGTLNIGGFLVGGSTGIPGVSLAPGDWGIPNISFSTGYQGLNDVIPAATRSRTFQLSDTIIWNHKKHNVRFGGDFRSMWIDVNRNSNPRGTFLFSSFNGTGSDFANFLLGLPAQESVQYAYTPDAFHANGYDFFVIDDWRVTRNLTLNLGLRYEYVAPFTESNNEIANLAVAPDFSTVTPVLPGQTGYNSSLINPDRSNWAPRIGIAWKPFSKTVVRAGYAINYNLGQYRSIVTQLALNPGLQASPFSFTQTLTATPTAPLLIDNGFTANVVNNTYGVDPNYRLGYVQMWNLNIQRETGGGTVVNIGYNGSKGTALDIVRAPGPPANTAPYLWETSQGFSILHAASVRVRKRLQHGIAIGGTYVFAKSIDNASSIGGGSTVVAQNDLDLSAERGLSSFDQRHRFTGDWTINLPFGDGRKWLTTGPMNRIFGGWEWNGSFTIGSGLPFTARILGSSAAVARGANGSLRADYNGQPISISDPSVAQWFNIGAFSSPCTKTSGVETCTLGTSGRNTIIGPGTLLFNMSMSKNIPIHDTIAFEIRADATNIFNTPQYTSIDTAYTCNFNPQGVCVPSPNSTFGQVVSAGNMRQIKMSMRFRF